MLSGTPCQLHAVVQVQLLMWMLVAMHLSYAGRMTLIYLVSDASEVGLMREGMLISSNQYCGRTHSGLQARARCRGCQDGLQLV
jgi:hypothetical protein